MASASAWAQAPKAGAPAPLSQPAHVHGELDLGVAIEGPTLVIEMRTPLDNLIGFERAPRTDVEKNSVEQTLARLRAAEHLFGLDPAGNCKLGPVALEAPVLGLDGSGSIPRGGAAPSAAAPHAADVKAATNAAPAPSEPVAHAELLASFAFNCTAADQVRFIDLDLFTAFPRLRQISAEIVSEDGQHKRTLKRPTKRLSWSP